MLVDVSGVQAALCTDDHTKSIPVVKVNGLGKLVGGAWSQVGACGWTTVVLG